MTGGFDLFAIGHTARVNKSQRNNVSKKDRRFCDRTKAGGL